MAARYFVGGGTGNWNSTTNWSDTNGGASGFSVPVSGDTVFLTAASGANTLTINVTSACTSIDCTGFTGTLAGASQLNVAGNVTLDAGMTNSYTGVLSLTGTGTLNTNGVDIYSLNTTESITTVTTLLSNIRVTSLYDVTGGNGHTVTGAFDIEITGTMSTGIGSSSIIFSGGTTITFKGNSTLSGGASASLTTRLEGVNITFNSISTIVTGGIRLGGNAVVTYTAGVMTTTGSTLAVDFIGGTNVSLNTSGMTWDSFRTITAGTTTLLSNLNLSGTLTIGVISTISGLFSINIASLVVSSSCSGTASIVFNSTGTWSQTAGGMGLNTTINTAGTLTISGSVSYNGILTYVTAASVVTAGSTLVVNGTATLNTNGIIWNNVTTTGNFTYTLTSNLKIAGTWNCNTTTAVTVSGAFNVEVTGNWNCNSTSGTVTFVNTTVSLTGNATWTGHSSGGAILIGVNITINCTTLTITNFNSFGANTTLTYTAGTVTTTGSTLILRGTGITLDTGTGVIWNNVTFLASVSTVTLLSNLNISNTLTVGIASSFSGAFNVNTASLATTVNQTLSGTSTLVFNSTGTWSGSGAVTINTNINTAGILTVSGSVTYNTGTLTYITASNVITAGSTLSISSSTTLNTTGVNWADITITAAATITINSLLSATGTLSLPNAAVTFTGTSGFSVGSLNMTTTLTATRILTLKSGNTYNISGFVVTGASNTFRYSIVSSTGGVQAILTLSTSGTQNVLYTNATDIDSSLGQTIWSFQGVTSNTLNWGNLNASSIGSGVSTFVN